jgi:drug/metabolite transporter (DMT)-like permease
MWGYLIAAAFLSNGLLMTFNKVFRESGSAAGLFGYLCIYFGAGLVVAAALWTRRPVRLKGGDVLLGGGIGLFSVLGAFFLLRALGHTQAVIVFPATSAGNVVVVALGSMVIFGESLSWKGWVGVLLGTAALALMS